VVAISSHDLLKSQRVSSSEIGKLPIGIAEIAGKRLERSESRRAVE
jgi:hypothetical protein